MGPEPRENDELGETTTHRLRNQCLFMRTLTVTLSDSVWAETFPKTISVVNQEGFQPENRSRYLRPSSYTASNSASSFQGKQRSPGPSEFEIAVEEDEGSTAVQDVLWSSDNASSGASSNDEEDQKALKLYWNPSMKDEVEVLRNVGSLTLVPIRKTNLLIEYEVGCE